MEPIVRHVRDLDMNERRVLERVIGEPLREDQQVTIQVATAGNQPLDEADEKAASGSGKLPQWCNVFEGLSPEQLADVERVILERSDLSRPSQ